MRSAGSPLPTSSRLSWRLAPHVTPPRIGLLSRDLVRYIGVRIGLRASASPLHAHHAVPTWRVALLRDLADYIDRHRARLLDRPIWKYKCRMPMSCVPLSYRKF